MEYSGNDFYCDVVLKGDMSLQKEYESDHVLAYHHTNPYCPVHVVVVPKKHIASFTALSEEDAPILKELIEVLQTVSSKVVKEHGAARILTNLGDYQDNKHLHFHVVFGEPLT